MKLEAKNISVEIAGKKIFSNISPTFPEGRRIAIIGPNGAGKSTLLKTLAKLNSDYSGEIFLGGENLKNISRKKLARSLAILPQSMQIPPDITVARLIDYGRFPYRSIFSRGNEKADREAVEWAICAVNLQNFRARQVNSLSGGERQRARIAMALAQQPEIILFDEPTTYLDIAHQLDVMQIISDINKNFKMTVIMVLHDINHALKFADEVIILHDEKIVQGAPSEVLSVEILKKVFGVRADFFTNSRGEKILSPIDTIKNFAR